MGWVLLQWPFSHSVDLRFPGMFRFHLAPMLILSFLLATPPVGADTVDIPVRFNTPYLTHLLRELVFEGQNGLSVWGDEAGCNDLTLSNPEVVVEDGHFHVISDADALTGIRVASRCIPLLNWRGKIKARQRVDIMDPAGVIAFSTVETTLLDTTGEVATISNSIWKLADEHVYPYLDRLRINFRSAVAEVRGLLPLFLGNQAQSEAHEVLNGFRLERLSATNKGLVAVASLDIDLSDIERVDIDANAAESALDEAEMARFIEIWDRLDAFLGFVIKIAAREGLDPSQKEVLFDTLIETRYALVAALSESGDLDNAGVRAAFINAWHQVAPIFRALSLKMRGSEALRFLGFVAAGDAIDAMDRLGPLTGWDVTVDGLRRLARMLIQEHGIDPLEVNPAVDPELRSLFDFAPMLELPPAQGSPDANLTEPPDLLGWVAASAFAEEETSTYETLDLDATVAGPDNLGRYLESVHRLLHSVSWGTLMVNPLGSEYHGLFRNMVMATAWQETCWRQYRQGSDGIEPMESVAGALGIMQVMPRVWRGFYDGDSLARDIEYNAAAGSEILHRYFVRYALRKGEHQREGGVDNLAKATYAAYNGGPRHLSRYRKAGTSKSLRDIDNAFWEKFNVVRDGNELGVRDCYPY